MIKNAIITSTMLGREDHGIMTFNINLKFNGGIYCGFGGYALDFHDSDIKTRVFRAESMEMISLILDVVGVDKWEDLPGKYVRFEDNGWGSTINKIGNIIEDKWLDVEDFFRKKDKTYD